MLLLSFLFSISLAVFIFAMLFGNQATMAWLIELLLVFYRMFIYIYDSFMGITYVRWWCIYWIGIVETLIALLSITNLGENIWYYLPCTWASRLSATYIVGSELADSSYLIKEFTMWGYVAIPITVVIFTGSLLWFNRWGGKSISE